MLDRDLLVKEVRRALTHLDDPLYLESLDLARYVGAIMQTPDLSKGQTLRRALRLAITSLDPTAGSPDDAIDACSYQVLYRYAIAKKSMVAIADELGISERKAYYELQHATEALALILEDLARPEPAAIASPSPDSASPALKVRRELERLVSLNEQDVDLVRLVMDVIKSAQLLADEHGVLIGTTEEVSELRVASNRVLLRQAILNLLSHMITTGQGHCVSVLTRQEDRDAVIELSYYPGLSPDSSLPETPYGVAAQILQALGLDWMQVQQGDGVVAVLLRIPLSQQRTVLIVDDNEGIIALFKRYLRNQPFVVCGAHSYGEVREVLEHAIPDVLILDIMLPNQDGWEVLEALRREARFDQVRVIICSIIKDPQLARALGAHAFLHKPVDRAQLLQALDQVLSSAA